MANNSRELQEDGTWVYKFLPDERKPRDLAYIFNARITEIWDSIEAKGYTVHDNVDTPEELIHRLAREYNGKAVFITEEEYNEIKAKRGTKAYELNKARYKKELQDWIDANPHAKFSPGFDINEIFK